MSATRLPDALPGASSRSISANGVLEPLVVQRNNGTYKTITGQKRLSTPRARRGPTRGSVPRASRVRRARAGASRSAAASAGASCRSDQASSGIGAAAERNAVLLAIAMAAMRLVAAAPDGQFSLVKTAAGARLSIDLAARRLGRDRREGPALYPRRLQGR